MARRIILWAILAMLAGAFVRECVRVAFIQDDVYITLRYVANFVHGHGLVFNIGERVEGYTCFLWVLILSAASLLSIGLEQAAQWLSVAFGVLSLAAAYLLARTIPSQTRVSSVKPDDARREWFDLAVPLLMAFSGAFSFWSVSGMETSLFVFLVLSGLAAHFRDIRRTRPSVAFAGFMVAAALTRPEGALVFAVIVGSHLIAVLLERFGTKKAEPVLAVRAVFVEAGLFAVPYAAYTLFRLFYYGYLFPNTFYAKTGMSSAYLHAGIVYFVSFAKSYALYGVLLVSPAVLFVKKELRYHAGMLFATVVVYSLYVVVVGGDVLALHRFFLPILPLVYILAVRTLGFAVDLFGGRKLRGVLAGTVFWVLVIGFAWLVNHGEKAQIESSRHMERSLVFKMKHHAEWLEERREDEGRTIVAAATTIGALGYFSNATVIDMLGLTDAHIAHHPKPIPDISGDASVPWKEKNYNADYVLSRKPDYIIFSTGLKPSAYAERALFVQKGFFRDYYAQYVTFPNFPESEIFYTRRDRSGMASAPPDTTRQHVSAKYIGLYIAALGLYNQFNAGKDPAVGEKLETMLNEIVSSAPPEFADAHRLLGDVYRIRGDLPRAEAYYREAVSRDDLNFESHYHLHVITQNRKDFTTSQYHLDKAYNSSPFGIVTEKPYHLGYILIQLKRYDEAVRELGRALKRVSSVEDRAIIRTYTASAYMDKGTFAEAEKETVEALRLKPDHAEAHYIYALLFSHMNRAADMQSHAGEAIRLAQAAVKTDPGNMDNHLLLAKLYSLLGQAPEANASYAEYQRLLMAH